MDIKEIEPGFTVSGQIVVSDLEKLAEKGVRVILNNRPDGEEQDQPPAQSLAPHAQALGMVWVDAPVIPRHLPEETVVQKVKDLLRNGEDSVHAYCKTGMRAAMVWAFVNAGERSADDLILTARHAGYELESLRVLFEQN